jgi:hypothetical protein
LKSGLPGTWRIAAARRGPLQALTAAAGGSRERSISITEA